MSSTLRQAPQRTIPVWDPLVRLGHWALVLAVATAWLTGDNDGGAGEQVHAWAGYTVGGIVAVRVVWGFVGPRHARFADFAFTPGAALGYLADLARGQARRYIGHSPAAAYMIAALLLALSGTVWTGLAAYADRGKGPLAGVPAPALVAMPARADEHPSRRDDKRPEGRESLAGESHETLANITIGLVALHLAGVALSSLAHRENLVRAMFTGRKRAEDEDSAA